MDIHEVFSRKKLPFTQIAVRAGINSLYSWVNPDDFFLSTFGRAPEGEFGPMFYPWTGPSPAILTDNTQYNIGNISRTNIMFVYNGELIVRSPNAELLKTSEKVFKLKYPTWGVAPPAPSEQEDLSSATLLTGSLGQATPVPTASTTSPVAGGGY